MAFHGKNSWLNTCLVTGQVLITAGLLHFAACTGQTKRVDPDALTEAEVGAGLSSQDFRSVCQRMARSLIQLEQIQKAANPPRIVVTEVQNETDDPLIRSDNYTHKIRTELIKSCERKIIFIDRDDGMTNKVKQENRDKERGQITGGATGTRAGADFLLTGRIENMRAIAGKGETGYYRLSFRLTNAVDQSIVWEDDYEIKKVSTKAGVYR